MARALDGTLARKLLTAIVLLSFGVAIVGAVSSFVIFRDRSEKQKIADSSLYIRERTRTEQVLFESLRSTHANASRELALHLAHMPEGSIDAPFDRVLPLRADGTRRSAPELFDGTAEADGDVTYGIGAFLANGRELTQADKRLFLAVIQVVSEHGVAARSSLNNFYFVTPNNRMVMFGPDRKDRTPNNRMVMFGPDRKDRLLYYREKAPASLDFSHEEMVQITLPANDPERATRCTGLRRLISDPKAPLSIACMTPVYAGQKYLGAWGTTMPIGSYLTEAIRNAPAGATSLIVSGKGALIAYPGFTAPGAVSAKADAWYRDQLKVPELVKRIKAEHSGSGVFEAAAQHQLVAYGHIDGPDWWLLIATPDAEIGWAAAQSASLILLLGLAAVLAEAVLLYFIVRSMVVGPLERLARHTGRVREIEADIDEDREIADLAERPDEIGALAGELAAERARAAELLRSLEARVRERTAELERANEAKSHFLANMSHELRTPLNGVIALSDSLRERQQDVESREMAALIASSGRLLEQVLTDILDFSKIEAGQMRLETVEFDMETLVFRIAELHRAAADEKNLEFGWRVAPEVQGRYRGDPVRITQILSNLLSNAVKFTERGGVELAVDLAPDGRLRLAVIDTGIGFDARVRERLFNRFMQADASMTRRFGGSGLGLAICASLASLMGGAISADAEPGKGARFEVTLPLPRADGAIGSANEANDRDGACLDGLNVLLAEDHPTNQRIVELVLAPTGAALTIAENGAQALAALENERFDVILMDMQMPVMDGLQAVRELRRREAEKGLARTPVIMLTANALGEHVEAAHAAGADLHMAKPLRPEALIRAVAECAYSESRETGAASAA